MKLGINMYWWIIFREMFRPLKIFQPSPNTVTTKAYKLCDLLEVKRGYTTLNTTSVYLNLKRYVGISSSVSIWFLATSLSSAGPSEHNPDTADTASRGVDRRVWLSVYITYSWQLLVSLLQWSLFCVCIFSISSNIKPNELIRPGLMSSLIKPNLT